MQRQFIISICSLWFLSGGCLQEQTTDSHFSPAEKADLIARARPYVIERIKLPAEHQAVVLNHEPAIGRYHLTGKFAQYSLTWNLSDNKQIVVNGVGDITKNESFKNVVYGDK